MGSIEQRRLGEGGPTVTALGFGAWPIAGGLGRVGAGVPALAGAPRLMKCP